VILVKMIGEFGLKKIMNYLILLIKKRMFRNYKILIEIIIKYLNKFVILLNNLIKYAKFM